MKRILTLLCCALSTAALSTMALAGPLDEKKAAAHLKAVAAGDVEALMADYADDAHLEWVGDPLDGRYRGKAEILKVWKKFVAANDGKPRPVKLGEIEPYANPKGASLEAEAEYGGKTPVNVWHLLVYRDGVLSSEIWQIAPSVKVGH